MRFSKAEIQRAWPGSRQATASEEARAVKALAEKLGEAPNMTKADAERFCRDVVSRMTGRGFHDRIWPRARRMAGLSEIATAGRKPKSDYNSNR